MSVLVMFVATASMPVLAKTVYVSDELNVPMRSGATNGHRIVKFLKSGTALTVLGASDDDKFTEVEVSGGKTGWVATKDIMDIPSARDRLVSVNKKLAKVRSENKELKSSISELKSEIRQLKNEQSELQNERTNLSNSLDDLKITASNPLALSKKNKQLKKELESYKENKPWRENENVQENEPDQGGGNLKTDDKDADDDGYRPDGTSTVASLDLDCIDFLDERVGER